METAETTGVVLIVAAVLLFFMLGVAILVVMDHKARLPGGFKRDPFSVSGMRRDHPFEAFLTGSILLGIITALVLSLGAALFGNIKYFKKAEPPKLLSQLKQGRSAERLRHFHNYPEVLRPTLGKKNICFECHGDYPHSKTPMIRTLLNMHTQFAGCMTCHVNEKKIPEKTLSLRWLNYSGIEVKGPPFGTDVDPRTGYLIQTDNYYSKIVAYSNHTGEEKLLEITADAPETREFKQVAAKLTDRDREAVKKTFHRLVRPKGRFCSKCHTQESKSYVPFAELGFSEQRITDLTNLNIIGLVEKYKDFYIPDLMGTGGGAGKGSAAGDSKLRRDPRDWWKKNYDSPGQTR